MSAAAAFKQTLGTEVAELLGPNYKYSRSRGELRAEVEGGHHVVLLAGSNKFSPHVGIDFYFGKNFAAAKRIEKELGIFEFPNHVQQYTPNCGYAAAKTYAGPCSWSIDITNPPQKLATEVANAIVGLSEPFLARYGTLEAARDAIAADDRNVFGGKLFWGQLLRLDLALNDLHHFERWAACLDGLSLSQAAAVIEKYRARRQ